MGEGAGFETSQLLAGIQAGAGILVYGKSTATIDGSKVHWPQCIHGELLQFAQNPIVRLCCLWDETIYGVIQSRWVSCITAGKGKLLCY